MRAQTAIVDSRYDLSTSTTQPATVTTRVHFAASPAQVWEAMKFYEAIETRPPLLLRLLLPEPIRTEGGPPAVGRDVECTYKHGRLVKRITRIEHCDVYEFEIVEQELSVGGGISLAGGSYALRELADGGTQVALQTRYVSSRWPRWLWSRLERVVCHWFHRYILRAMRRSIEAG